MFQIVFNKVSAGEINALPRVLQLHLLAELQTLPREAGQLDPKRFGTFERDGRRLVRCRAGDYRIYFEQAPEGVVVHRILHRNTIRDFLFRSQLPMVDDSEEHAAESRIWELVAEGEASGRK